MDQVQPSTSCLPKILATRKALHALSGSRTPRATKMLAQCLFHAKWLALPKSDGPWIRIEYAGSETLCGRISYSHAYDSIGSLLNRLTPRLLGCSGQTFVTYDLCKKTMSDQSANELYEALAPTTYLSSMMQADKTGKSPPLCLQLIIKRHQTDEDKVNFINEALRQATTDEQLLRILEIIGQIEYELLRVNTLTDNIHHFLNVPYLKIAKLTTNIFLWKNTILKALTLKLIERNDLEKALEIAKTITPIWKKDEVLEAVALKLTQKNDLKNALEVVQLIDNDFLRNTTLYTIAKKLVEKDDLEKALEVAGKITNIWRKDQALKAIALKLVENDDLKKALKIAGKITNIWRKDQALKAIALKLVENDDLKKALKIAGKITDIWRKDQALKAIAKKYFEKKDGTANPNRFTKVKAYMMSVIPKIVKIVCFAILSLITYKLITSIKNASLLQRLSTKTKA